MGTLGVAVSSSILGACLVGRILAATAVLLHLRKVDSTVKPATQFGHIDVKRKLLVLELKHVILGIAGHKVDARADVRASNKLKCESVATRRDTIRARIIRTVEGTVGSACLRVGAKTCVPFVARVTVGVTASGMQPAPVGIESDGARLRRAATLGTFLHRDLGVILSRLRSSLLCTDRG
jgi:hypothetical protein